MAMQKNRLSQSKFVCQAFGYTANADVNVVSNILAVRYTVLACGGMVQLEHLLGTHRNDSGDSLSLAGIHLLQDVWGAKNSGR